MRNLIIAAAAVVAAAPAAAAAQDVYPYDYPYDPRDEEIAAALPDQAHIDRMTFALDRVMGALLDIDIAPLAEAVDPDRAWRGERTLREMAERDDPYFEERMRHDLYGVSAGMGRMMEAFATLTPVLRRSLEQTARDVEEALDDYPRR